MISNLTARAVRIHQDLWRIERPKPKYEGSWGLRVKCPRRGEATEVLLIALDGNLFLSNPDNDFATR